MRLSLALLLLVPSVAVAQPNAAAKWVLAREAPGGGFALAEKGGKPGLRATSGAARALRYLGAEVPNKDKHAAFVLSCFDPATGGFAEPGGKPDVTITAIGVMAAAELGVPKEKYAKAMDYLKANAKTFEDVRIGAAAVEAWGVKDCPFKLDEWAAIARKHIQDLDWGMPPHEGMRDGGAREIASSAAFFWRLGLIKDDGSGDRRPGVLMLKMGQREDGGWGKKGEKASDIESTYRVMRALMLVKDRPNDVAKLREFIAKHRNADGGYGVKPGEASSMSGAYYAALVTKWLDEMK